MNTGAVLYFEDDENDVFLVQRAFKNAGIGNPLKVATTTDETIEYMRNAGRGQHLIPSLILLDLNLPRTSGFEVLKWIRQQPRLGRTPVLIFTSSAREEDVEKGYELGANAYLVKPSDPEKLFEMVRVVKDFWLVHNCGPQWTSAGVTSGIHRIPEPSRRKRLSKRTLGIN